MLNILNMQGKLATEICTGMLLLKSRKTHTTGLIAQLAPGTLTGTLRQTWLWYVTDLVMVCDSHGYGM